MLSNVSLQAKIEQKDTYTCLKKVCVLQQKGSLIMSRHSDMHVLGLQVISMTRGFFKLCMYRSILIRSINMQGAFWICSGCVPVPLDLWFAHKQAHFFYKCCHKQCRLRIDGGMARKRGASGWGETAFFWHIREDLMVAIKEQMHWPWTQDLKDIFMGLLVSARDQTKCPDGNNVSKWPNGRACLSCRHVCSRSQRE